MTSEAPYRPGQEPGEVSPGGTAPYGDRPAPQDNGYPGTPDLGWAPPPPAPAWPAQDDPAPAWGTPGEQPANRGSAQVPPPAEPGAWAATGQPAWAAGPSTGPGEPSPSSWGAPTEQTGPAWSAGQGEPPAWAQPAEPGARGAAQVPAPATVPHETWATPAPQPDDDPSRSGGWQATSDPQADRSGGWAVGAAHQQDDPNRADGWTPPQPDDQPAWGRQDDQAAPAWAPAQPAARASAKVPGPGAQAENAWSTSQDDPTRSGGWQAGGSTPHDDPARSGGWETGPAGGQDDDPDRSGGWAAGRAAGPADARQQTGWDAPDEQPPATAWSGAAAPQQREQDEPAQSGWGAAGDRPEAGAWGSAEAPARASASVPSPDSPPAWGGNQDNPAQWTPQRPAIPEAEPWSQAEAWGHHSAEAQPAESPSHNWEPTRAEEPPVYQPAPGPGISPANAVPLPPQEQRVPGAALAASPPTDYAPPAQFAPAGEPADQDPQAYEPERAGAAWGAPEPSHQEPQSPAAPVVPGPRTSPEAGGSGSVSASASVPLASRVMPPTDQGMRPAATPAPQPRVYGRPIPPEPEEAPGHVPNGYPGDGPRFDAPGPEPRADEPEHPVLPNAFAAAPPAPSSPGGPPPFPPGVPSFVDPAANNRPVNGVHPHSGERDPFGPPAGQQDPFAHQGQYGGPGGQPDPFGGPAGGRASVAVPGQGPGPMGEPGQGGFPPAFPPPPPQAPPTWHQGPANDPDQGRFDAFKPDAAPQTEAPAPKVRNGKVLALVLLAAVAILAIPLGALALLGKLGGDDKPAPFDPAVGSCIKQSGTTAAAADCAEPGAFKVVSRVDSKDQCADPTQPTVELKSDVAHRWVCLQPAGK